MDREVLYRLPTVAKILGVTVRQVRHLVSSGKIEGTRLSERNWRVTKRALDNYLDRLQDM